MKKIAVYTAISPGYDTLKPVNVLWQEDADFIAFVDPSEKKVDGWQFADLPSQNVDPCRNAKMPKILSHNYVGDYELSVWLDGSVEIVSRVRLAPLLTAWLGDQDMGLFPHRKRRCIYEEADACIARGKDCPDIISRQVEHYSLSGYPANNGLAECTVLVRRNTKRVASINVLWYREIETYSRRDQLSFDYVIHSTGGSYVKFPGSISDNPHFLRHPHRA